MQITYIGHSGFFVELTQSMLLFDYYQGRLPKFSHGKRLYVFVIRIILIRIFSVWQKSGRISVLSCPEISGNPGCRRSSVPGPCA